MVADDADALTEDVVVDLIIGAGDLDGGGSSSGRGVGGAGGSSSDSRGGAVTKGVAALGSGPVGVLVGLVLQGVVGACGDGCGLRADGGDEQGYEEKAYVDPHPKSKLNLNYIIDQPSHK